MYYIVPVLDTVDLDLVLVGLATVQLDPVHVLRSKPVPAPNRSHMLRTTRAVRKTQK